MPELEGDDVLVRQTDKSASIVLGHLGSPSRKLAHDWVELSPEGFVLTLEEGGRTPPQSAKFYAICTQLEKSDLTWAGERQNKKGWHDLLIHGWMVATGKHPILLEGLHGGRVSLLMGTSDMSKSEMSELIEYTIAWVTERGIEVASEK